MKCHGCGHEFANTSTRCPRCHRSTLKRGRASSDSRLLEFPRKVRVAPPTDVVTPTLPAWRIELNEKVRAIRAKRGTSSSQGDTPGAEIGNSFEAGARTGLAVAAYDEQPISYGRNVTQRVAPALAESIGQSAAPVASGRRSSTNIVEAALTRVKRATENASRAALPKIEPARSIQPQVSLSLDREATARALAPAPEIEPRTEPLPAPRPELVESPIVRPALIIETSLAEKPRVEEIAPAAPAVSRRPRAGADIKPSPVMVIDELEPLDYLEAEIRKVDKALGAEFVRNESPSILTHLVISVVDLVALALSSAPFLAIVSIYDGSFVQARTRLATGGIVLLVAFFYLALTQSLCGRTFGMMLTNTRVVDELTFEAPSASRALLRTAGYFVGAMPALAGIIWAAFNSKHRGWQDFLSGTIVVRDF
jgi:uncharacterized RDD family membrane protein YckC